MPLQDPFDDLKVPRDVVCEFFAVFARCEYAMKETTYSTNVDGRAAPAWPKLAAAAATWVTVDAGSDLEEAIEYLTQSPPLVQTFANGWQARPLQGANKISQAIDAAKRVRNNLFHGGKHTPESAPGRDERLVRSSLVLLRAVIEQATGDLRGAYNYG